MQVQETVFKAEVGVGLKGEEALGRIDHLAAEIGRRHGQ